MKFFGVHIEDLESERFLAASNDQIATWLFLHALCSKQLNGGTISEASNLPERFWSRHGVSADIIKEPSPLWSWADDGITVEPYDIDGESLYIAKSKGGKEGAAKRWKGGKNRTPNRSPNRSQHAPNQTRDNQTRDNQTRDNQTRDNQRSPDLISSSDEGDGLFSESLERPSSIKDLAESIYQEYPKHEAKKAGVKAIMVALKKHDPGFLLKRTKAYASAIKWRDRQFIPLPATWFNGERYNDDPDSWKQPTTSSTNKPTATVNTGRRTSNIEEL